MEWKQTGRWCLVSTNGRYRIAKTLGPRSAGGPSVTAYSGWIAGPSDNPYASVGWTLLGYYDTDKQAQQAIEEYQHDQQHPGQCLHPAPA